MADAIRAIKHRTPQVKVEVLTSDYRGDQGAILTVVDANPDVYAHNIETTRALTRKCARSSLRVRPNARRAALMSKALRPDMLTKSSIMLGLGETDR